MGFEQLKAEYIDHMGTDLSVVNAARVSFDKQSEWDHAVCDCGAKCEYECVCGAWSGEFDTLKERDEKLINYLARHGHWTPFAHTAITLRISAPIFVRSQLFKHKVGLVENEISRRYVDSEPEFYVPDVWRGRPKNKKQGSGEDLNDSLVINECYVELLNHCKEFYKDLVETGVAPEQARMVLPQSMMTQWFWTGNVVSFARVYGLRYADDAQAETGEIARKIGEIIKPLFPVSWEALTSRD